MMTLGFLPHKCYARLPNKYEFMQPVLDNLAENVCQDIRPIMDALPAYNDLDHTIDDLPDEQQQFMYSFLSIASNRYVWCTGVNDAKHHAILPDIIGRLWHKLSEKIGIKS